MFFILRWAAVLLFILLGSFLFTLTIGGLGIIGNTVKALLGVSCFYIAGLFIREAGEITNTKRKAADRKGQLLFSLL